jgi:C4-dicarboxylate-specific signal transduction histidine kinase
VEWLAAIQMVKLRLIGISAACAKIVHRRKRCGIEPASEPHLFDVLYTTKDEGLGLGLSISRKIVAAHGGRTWLEKNKTQGATFTFALPVRQTSELPENN